MKKILSKITMQIRKISTHLIDKGENTRQVLKDVYKVLRGNISYGGMTQSGLQPDNIDGVYGTIADSGTVDTLFTVNHTLNRIPIGFHVINQNKAGSFYGTPTSFTTWSSTQIFLKCNAANVAATFFIF
jgi:hypothetical protein